MKISTHNLHLDSGEIVEGTVKFNPGEPLQVFPGELHNDSMHVEDNHVALARYDPHVHFRESAIPTREEFENDPYKADGVTYEEIREGILAETDSETGYDVERGSIAALKGGVGGVAAMGNTFRGPIGEKRHNATREVYQKKSHVMTHVWPRMEPGVPAIKNQSGKDFGSTFGGAGLSLDVRQEMYNGWRGEAVRTHNDRARPDITIQEFAIETGYRGSYLHQMYFDGETVLAEQRDILAMARNAGIRELTTLHIPTGPALQMILDERLEGDIILPAEIGLDYLFWNRDELGKNEGINYRRPAHPSTQDQCELIELLRDATRAGIGNMWIGSDHAPHAYVNKVIGDDGMPKSPGTRNIELTIPILTHLQKNYGFTWKELDDLSARNPADHVSQYANFDKPIGRMENGYAANVTVFDPNDSTVSVPSMKYHLSDPQYHSAYQDIVLPGKVLYTVSDGKIWDVRGKPKRVDN